MKAQQKKLKQLNEKYLALLEERLEIREAYELNPSEKLEARAEQIEKAIDEVDSALRIALKDAMKELGPIYGEIHRIMNETAGQTLEEFRKYIEEKTGGTGVACSISQYAEIASRAADTEKEMAEQAAEVQQLSTKLSNYQACQRGELEPYKVSTQVVDDFDLAPEELNKPKQ
ncbi:MAG: hypothetical protein ACPGSB_00305 [Opitutales bacterium]